MARLLRAAGRRMSVQLIAAVFVVIVPAGVLLTTLQGDNRTAARCSVLREQWVEAVVARNAGSEAAIAEAASSAECGGRADWDESLNSGP